MLVNLLNHVSWDEVGEAGSTALSLVSPTLPHFEISTLSRPRNVTSRRPRVIKPVQASFLFTFLPSLSLFNTRMNSFPACLTYHRMFHVDKGRLFYVTHERLLVLHLSSRSLIIDLGI